MKTKILLSTCLFLVIGCLHAQKAVTYRLSGTAKEMAQKFAAKEKERFLSAYQQVMEGEGIEESSHEERQAFKKSKRFEKYIDSETQEEMKAFAEKADIPYSKVLLYNCFYDLLQIQMGCRQVVVWSDKTPAGNLFHARNLDWSDWGDAIRGNNIFLVRNYPEKNRVATLTWPGFFGALTGCNDQGIVIAYNQYPGGILRTGEPIFLILKRILREAKTLADVTTMMKESRFVSNGSIMVSSAEEKQALVIDLNRGKVFIRHPNETSFIINNNTNYFSLYGKLDNSRYQRCATYQNVMKSSTLDADGLKKVMSHPDVMLSINLLTAIFDVKNNRMYLSCGKYKAAEGPYEEYRIFKRQK